MKITDILRAEHTVFHHLFDHIEMTAPKLKTLAEVKSVAVLIDKVMAPHSKTEDDLFIEPLEHCFDQIGHKETFHHEHELIEEMFAGIQKAGSLKAARRDVEVNSRRRAGRPPPKPPIKFAALFRDAAMRTISMPCSRPRRAR